MKQKKKSQVGQTTRRVLKRAVKISSSAIHAAVETARQDTNSAELVKPTSNAGSAKPKGKEEKELQIIPLRPSVEEDDRAAQKSSCNTSKTLDHGTGETKKAKVIFVEDGNKYDTDMAYEVDAEEAKRVENLCLKGNVVFDDEPEHPLFRERHKIRYAAWKFRQNHPKFTANGRKIGRFCWGLLKMSMASAVAASMVIGLVIFVGAKYEFKINNDYRVLDITDHLGTTTGADVQYEDILLNADVYSDFSSYLQLTPVGAFNHEYANKAISGANFDYTQSCYVGGYTEGFVVDFWVCLPTGRTNDSVCIAYPDQISSSDRRPLQFYLVNEEQYRNALLQFLRPYAADDEYWSKRIEELSDASAQQIVGAISGTIGDEYFYQDKTRYETWRIALDTRTIAGQINLNLKHGRVDMIRISSDEVMEEFADIETCRNQQAQGKIPRALNIPSSTAKIVHYQVPFSVSRADYRATYSGNGILANTKLDAFILCWVVWMIALGLGSYFLDIHWVKPAKDDAKDESKKDDSAKQDGEASK